LRHSLGVGDLPQKGGLARGGRPALLEDNAVGLRPDHFIEVALLDSMVKVLSQLNFIWVPSRVDGVVSLFLDNVERAPELPLDLRRAVQEPVH